MLQNFDASDVDMILPMTTPVITGACGMVKRKPVVFTYCSDPIAAGAGTTFSNHLPHVTGIGSFPPVQDMVDLIHAALPQAKSVGTIYNASEANSVKVVQVARGLFAAAGMRLEEATVGNSSEVLQAAQALASRKVDAFYIQGDNTVIQAIDAVVRAARDAHVPIRPSEVPLRASDWATIVRGMPRQRQSLASCWARNQQTFRSKTLQRRPFGWIQERRRSSASNFPKK